MATAPFSFGSLFRNTQQVTPSPSQRQPIPANQQGQNGAPNSSMTPPGSQQGNPNPSGQPGGFQQQPGGQQQDPSKPNSPLDAFKDIWNTPDNGGSDQNADPFASPLFQTDPAKIREAAGQIDFLSQVPQELMQKAMSGSDPQAFMQVINAVAQNSLGMALQLSTATTEQAGQKIGQRFNGSLPGKLKSFQLESQQSSNPVLSHPAVRPMLEMARKQFAAANTDATPQQIQQMAEDYMMQFASQLVPQQKPNNVMGGGQEQPEQNWMNWAMGPNGGNGG